MRYVSNDIKIVFLDVDPSISIVGWKNLWETSSNIPCGITTDGLYYVMVDYRILPEIASRESYEIIFPTIKDSCSRDSFPTTDCLKMEIYCDNHGRFYADANKEKPLVLFYLGCCNSYDDFLEDLDGEIVKSFQTYVYAGIYVEIETSSDMTRFYMLLPYFIDNVLVIDALYKIFSLKILEFNSINNFSLHIERSNYFDENKIIFYIRDNENIDKGNLRRIFVFDVPNPNI